MSVLKSKDLYKDDLIKRYDSYMLCEIVDEVSAQLRVLDVLEHFFDGDYDPFGIGSLELSVEEFLHAVVL